MVERDLDEETGNQPNNNFRMEPHDDNKQTDNFQTNESLGMDGVDIVLEDYNQQQPQSMGSDTGQKNQGQNPNEESKDRQPSRESAEDNKSALIRWCPWLTCAPLAPYF